MTLFLISFDILLNEVFNCQFLVKVRMNDIIPQVIVAWGFSYFDLCSLFWPPILWILILLSSNDNLVKFIGVYVFLPISIFLKINYGNAVINMGMSVIFWKFLTYTLLLVTWVDYPAIWIISYVKIS